jgi:hypothetical protein
LRDAYSDAEATSDSISSPDFAVIALSHNCEAIRNQ